MKRVIYARSLGCMQPPGTPPLPGGTVLRCGTPFGSNGEVITQPAPVPRLSTGAASAAFVGGLAIGVAVLGVTGYYWGRAVAPSRKQRSQYGTVGAISNILAPVIGPLVLTGIGLAKAK